MLSLTLFSTFKPLEDDEYRRITRNAIGSWVEALRLHPTQIVLYVENRPFIESIVNEFNCDTIEIRDITKVNNKGLPTIDHIFHTAQDKSSAKLFCYINGDIIIPPDFMERIQPLLEVDYQFLLGATPFEMEFPDELKFEGEWYYDLVTKYQGHWRDKVAIDLFIFTRHAFRRIPPFAIGRVAYDNYLIGHGKNVTDRLIDGSIHLRTIHQTHDYRPFMNMEHLRGASESVYNRKLAGGYTKASLRQATHILTDDSVIPITN